MVLSHIFVTFSIILSIYPEPVVHWLWWLISQQRHTADVLVWLLLWMIILCSRTSNWKSRMQVHLQLPSIDWFRVFPRHVEITDKLAISILWWKSRTHTHTPKQRALPCFSTSFKGSTPGERMKNMGVAGPDSSKEMAKSSDLPITYLLPSFSSTKSLRAEYESVLLNPFLLSLTDKLTTWRVGFVCSTVH